MSTVPSQPWAGRVLGALLVVVAVAGGARLAVWLLAPLVPWLIAIIVFVVVLAVALGRWRR